MGNDKANFGWKFDNSYSRLSSAFFERVLPAKALSPQVVLFNDELARDLGLNAEELKLHGHAFLSGHELLEGSEPLAQAYAGHQFGHFNMLGDGRANLLGEHLTPQGERYDIQLKGSGPTRFSRRGDGLAALGPMLREYIISEAMHALGIPTTRSLAVVTTGGKVIRENLFPAAVLTRVASSHIRVGTFQYASVLEEGKNLRELADYTLQRHYPELVSAPEPYLAMLNAVIERQASLIARWMEVGFIHGVMNTDNMTLSGETIDYGPCAFMDRFSLSTVFSSIDSQGRYAYGQQPSIAQWNLARLAEALLPLLSTDQEEAIAKAESALASYTESLQRFWLSRMRGKLGLRSENGRVQEDTTLVTSLLELMEKNRADYTNTFRALSNDQIQDNPLFNDSSFLEWRKDWLAQNPDFKFMLQHNPAVIPRNHLVEKALSAAVENADYSVVRDLLDVLKNPFVEPTNADYTKPPGRGTENYKTFCGT